MEWLMFFTMLSGIFSAANTAMLIGIIQELRASREQSGDSETLETASAIQTAKSKKAERMPKRFTDKTREWINARETASRR